MRLGLLTVARLATTADAHLAVTTFLFASVVTRARPGIFDERKVSQPLRKSSLGI